MTCAVEGCDKPTFANGYCGVHNHRVQRYGDPSVNKHPTKGLTAIEVVEHHGWTVTASGCWEYNGRHDDLGYGNLNKNGKHLKAHRVMYEARVGPIPEGRRLVRHTCDNPPCVNPEHLVLGTDADNTRDRMERGRSAVKLSTEQVQEIRDRYAAKKANQYELAAAYGVSQSAISLIVRDERRTVS